MSQHCAKIAQNYKEAENPKLSRRNQSAEGIKCPNEAALRNLEPPETGLGSSVPGFPQFPVA